MTDEDSDHIEDPTHHIWEDWMLPCQLQPTYNATDTPEDNSEDAAATATTSKLD